MAGWVSDEVWAKLDPGAGRLPIRAQRRLHLAPVLALLLIAAGLAGWRAGLLLPRVNWANQGESADTAPDHIMHSLAVINRGWFPLTITAVGRSGPGLDLIGVRGTLPTTLAPGQAAEFLLYYQITNCAAVPASDWPIPVQVSRPWGDHTVYVPVPGMDLHPPDGMSVYVGANPRERPWQRALANEWCARPHPS